MHRHEIATTLPANPLASQRRSVLAGLALLLAALTFGAAGQPSAAQRLIDPALGAFLSSTNRPVSVIVQTAGPGAQVEDAVRANGGTVTGEYPAMGGFAATVSADLARRLNRDPRVLRINQNAKVELNSAQVNASNLVNTYEASAQIVHPAWNQTDGSEVQVAVLDTGVWPHNDLVTSNQATVPANGGNRLLALTTNPNATDVLDHYGHGTHVAGIIAGNGHDSNGQFVGVAPNSLLVSDKVSDDAGNVNEGDVITGLEWIYLANQHGMRIRIANLSLSSTVAESYNYSALDAMVEKLWASGVVIVTSAGAGSGAVNSAPGNDPFAITVGSVEDHGQSGLNQMTMASWSPYGKTQDGFAKPELVADGSHVVSLLAPGSAFAQSHSSSVVGSTYLKLGGTSMAAAQTTGLAALMLQANPGMTNNQVKQALMETSNAWGPTAYTSWLGQADNAGGFISGTAIGDGTPTSANRNIADSFSFNREHMAIVHNGTVFIDANFPNAAWNGTAWNGTAWNSSAWNGTAWNGTQFNGTAWNGTAWNGTAWNTTTWSGTAWNGTAWNGTAWNGTAWNGTAWNGTAWNGTAWNGTAWNADPA